MQVQDVEREAGARLELMLELGHEDKVVAEELADGRAEGVVDGAELFAALHLNKGLDGAVVRCHFEHCCGEVPERGVEAGEDAELGAVEARAFEVGVVVFAEADVLAFVAL